MASPRFSRFPDPPNLTSSTGSRWRRPPRFPALRVAVRPIAASYTLVLLLYNSPLSICHLTGGGEPLLYKSSLAPTDLIFSLLFLTTHLLPNNHFNLLSFVCVCVLLCLLLCLIHFHSLLSLFHSFSRWSASIIHKRHKFTTTSQSPYFVTSLDLQSF